MVTRNYVMFPVTPRRRSGACAKGMPPVAWEPTKGAFVGVMKRNANVDSIRWFEIEPDFSPYDERLGGRRENPL
jgi:carotenoid cleavage dioxygenase